MTRPVRILSSGPQALLAEYDSLDDVMGVSTRLLQTMPAGLVDVVPAARTVLVTVHDTVDLQAIVPLLDTRPDDVVAKPDAAIVEVEVVYDGDDLQSVADACGMSTTEVTQRHTAALFTVAFCGFMPGFSYLIGLDPRLHLPRRPTPRTRVPAGSVAIASEFSAVYPAASPGGWHLLGHTDAVMWDQTRPMPALLPPGARVRFVAR